MPFAEFAFIAARRLPIVCVDETPSAREDHTTLTTLSIFR
jgi:hypothetical protein